MKTFPWRKIALVIGIAVVLAGVFFMLPSTGEKKPDAFVNPAFGEHISTFTSGVISSGSPVQISMVYDMVDSTMVGTESSVKLFDFRPSVGGKAVWADRKTVVFQPEGRLIPGQVYTVRFYLSKLMPGLPEDLQTFEYTFQVIPQNFEVTIENVVPYVTTELTRQKVEGLLFTADVADPSDVEKILSASQDGKDLKVAWAHDGDGKQHRFAVEDVTRKEVASKVKLRLSGAPIGVGRNDETEVDIPSLGDFRLMNARVVQSPSQYVVLQFSDPLKENQNLAGLITVGDIADLDFEIQKNEIFVYPPVRQTGVKTINIEEGIRNVVDYRMTTGTTAEVTFEEVNPAVRFTSRGNILPTSDGLVLPFEAVNLRSVDVRVIRIFESNILQFLQANDYDGISELRRVGKPVIRKSVSLENSGITDLGKWNRFTLDLSTFINPEPGAIYQVQIGFRKDDAVLSCLADERSAEQTSFFESDEWNEPENEESYWDYYDEYYYGEDYDWEQRDNPCHASYYTGQRDIRKNILASDLGLLAKRGGEGTTLFFANDLRTTSPLPNVIIEVYNFQQQLIGTATTDASGKASVASREKPFAAIARNGAQRGYLKLFDGESLSLSSFDVSGERVDKGLKGFLYGERGVWRPGDSLFLTFVLEDRLRLLPAAHPVVLELQDPQGQIATRLVRSSGENGFYNFATATRDDAPTGTWTARVKVGGTEFTQPVRIETVKPNRLKIKLDFGKDRITAEDNNVSGDLQVNWLHGAPGRNLKAEFEVVLTKMETRFDRYPDYTFEDPSREFVSEAQTIFEGSTDAQGHATVSTTLDPGISPPGMLQAVFRGKVFEESGNFSIDRFSLPYYPYRSFTGIRLPAGDRARGMLLTDTTHRVDVVVLDAEGKPVTRDKIEMSLYKLRWRWWWDNSGEDAAYLSDSYTTLVSKGEIATPGGKGKWNFRVNSPEWGRFLVKAYDPVSGHSSSKIVYLDWPGWAGRARGESEGAAMLSFSSDKTNYNIGEKATVVIPGSGTGRALVSIENGSRVIRTDWVETKKGDTRFSFDVTDEMTPNVFVHITLLQPHAQAVNDLPIRLYGVIPIRVENPGTRLEPVIEMPEVLEPGKEVVIRVSEKSNRTMTYTVAMVDEGLLDLTRFRTPDPWGRFYAREALGVRTWDLYDHVVGAFGGNIERLLSVGGDEELKGKDADAKANRFRPVVKFLGPFTLDGKEDEHRFVMPEYVGSVRTMVVAGFQGAYGAAEQTTPVRKPLMVLATLPRVLGPEESLKLPVTIFTMQKNIRNVRVEIRTQGPLQVKEKSRTVEMPAEDMTIDFDLSVGSATGTANVEVIATSGSFQARDVISIEIRNPNPPVTRSQEAIVEAGKTWSGNVMPIGITGTNSAVLEVSSLPPINLGQRLKYLLQYPYGCIEQTVSSVFPQLYVDMVKPLTEGERTMIQSNVRAGIEKLKSFQQPDGGFAYWPGQENADSWSTTYAGHFLVEAETKGYFVPNEMIRRWKKFQRQKATGWRRNSESYSNELIQAYRLYSLAVAGDADMSSMNRLRELDKRPLTATWMLAATYAKAGQPEAARAIIANASTAVPTYQEMAYSYGSDLRDKAIILETLVLLEDRKRGFELLRDISEALSYTNRWMSTQTAAWCLKSAGLFAGFEKKGPLVFTYSWDGEQTEARTDLPVAQVGLRVDQAKGTALKVVNSSSGALFVRVISEGTPARGNEEDEESNLSLYASYTDLDGNAVDPGRLEQGTEFIAAVTVYNSGVRGNYRNMALSQVFPSGWEINNLRLDEAESRLGGDRPTYQDIRDDRVYTYFDLGAGQKKTFKVLLTASYAGTYYLPAVSCEAMYDRSVYSRKKGRVVEVIRPETQ